MTKTINNLSRKKILFVGPKIQSQAQLGGAVVSFEILLDYCRRKDIDFELIYINEYESSRIKSYAYTVLSFLKTVRSVDIVMLNFSSGGYKFLSPILYLIAKIFSKKVALRMFGGNVDDVHQKANGILKFILSKTILKSNLIFLQTQKLIAHFRAKGVNNIKWLPTSRPVSKHRRAHMPYRKRFIFVGRVVEQKGIVLLKEAFDSFGEEYTIHYFGPSEDKELLESLGDNYKGILEPTEVTKTLSDYDVFCFPTYYPGEGYPGVIIESFMAGIPVVASDWLSIPELIVHGECGLLVEPRNIDSLKEQILKIDDTVYETLRQGAVDQAKIFDSESVNDKVLKDLESL